MAPDRHGDEGSDKRFADYKVLFYGACSCIVLLGGYAFELSSKNGSDEVERNSTTNRAQWERLKELDERTIELRAEIRTLRRDVDELRDNGRRR